MKRTCRANIYETNSSSSHVICMTNNDTHVTTDNIVWDINKENDFDTVYINPDGTWSLRNISDGYGRYPFAMLTTFEEKFKYAMCEFLGCLYEDDPEWQKWYDEFKQIATEVIPGFKDFCIHTKDIDIYMDEDGNEILYKDLHYDHWNKDEDHAEYYYLDNNGNKHNAIFNEDEYLEMPNIGMIDHQSAGLLKNFLREKGIDLKEFLTNKKYVVVINSDETQEWEKYCRSGLINMNFITEIYDTSGEDIEYQEWLKENGGEN